MTVSYRRSAVLRLAGAALGTAWVVAGVVRAGAWPVLVVVAAVWALTLRTLVVSAELTEDALVLRTPLGTERIPRADVVAHRLPFWMLRLRRRRSLLPYDLPLTRGTKELLVALRQVEAPARRRS